MPILRLVIFVAILLATLGGTMARAQQSGIVGAWVTQGMDPATGTAIRVEYSFMPTGQFQKSFGMQVGASGGYDWIAGRWFTEGQWLRLEVQQHYSTSTGSNGPLPPGELWLYAMPNMNTLVLTHSACVQQQLQRPDCVLQLTRAQ
ncbi:MAG: hypothetical protein KDJ88_21965 [Bauldia sp.]|nr:hypothetical protein [Bauldia sp.]